MKTLDDLKPAEYNPRLISKHAFQGLIKSIESFGDISGITFNKRTGNLVAGHQRREALRAIGGAKKLQITVLKQYEQPTEHGTVAIGMIDLKGEPVWYREVDWDSATERKANVVANNPHIQGEFDQIKLAEMINEFRLDDDFMDLQLNRMEELDLSDFDPAGADDQSKLDKTQEFECPECGHTGSSKEFKGDD